MPEAPSLSITELSALRKEVKKQEQVLKEKRAKVEAFQGLPPVRSFNSGPSTTATYADAPRRISSSLCMLCRKLETNKWN